MSSEFVHAISVVHSTLKISMSKASCDNEGVQSVKGKSSRLEYNASILCYYIDDVILELF